MCNVMMKLFEREYMPEVDIPSKGKRRELRSCKLNYVKKTLVTAVEDSVWWRLDQLLCQEFILVSVLEILSPFTV